MDHEKLGFYPLSLDQIQTQLLSPVLLDTNFILYGFGAKIQAPSVPPGPDNAVRLKMSRFVRKSQGRHYRQ